MLRERQLSLHPLCQHCMEVYSRVSRATVVHHATPHKGDKQLFFNATLVSLCKHCHDSDMQELEKSGSIHIVGLDGWSVGKK